MNIVPPDRQVYKLTASLVSWEMHQHFKTITLRMIKSSMKQKRKPYNGWPLVRDQIAARTSGSCGLAKESKHPRRLK